MCEVKSSLEESVNVNFQRKVVINNKRSNQKERKSNTR
jgi:hypothetical protein